MANEANKYAALEALFKDYKMPQFKAASDANFLAKLGANLYNTGGAKAHIMNEMKLLPKEMWTPETIKKIQASMAKGAQTPFSSELLRNNEYTMKDGTVQNLKRSALGDTMGVVGQNIKAHPGAALGTALNTGAGIAGLLDNDKFGGQLIGTAAGAIIPAALKMKLGPLAAYNVAMGAGNLGALFDNLRAKKEQQQQYYGG